MKYSMKEKFNKLKKLKDQMNKLKLKKRNLIKLSMYSNINQEIQ